MWRLFTAITGGWVGPAVLLGVLTAATGGAWLWHTHKVDSARQQGRDEVTTQWHASEALRTHLAGVAAQQVKEKEAQHEQALKRERARRAADAATAQAAVDAARSQLDSLQHAIGAADARACGDTAGPDLAARIGADGAASTTGQLLGNCASALVRMGEDAESLAQQTRGLQGWADAVMQTQGDPIAPEKETTDVR